PTTSRVSEERYASRRPYDARATASTVLRTSSTRSGFLERGVKVDVHRPYFDCAGRHRRAAHRPLERRVEGCDVKDDEAAELLLGLGKRAVLNVTPAFPQSDRRPRRDVLERRAADVGACRYEGLVVRPPRGDVRVALPVLPGLEVLRSLIDQHDVLHRDPPDGMAIRSRRDRLTMMTFTGS